MASPFHLRRRNYHGVVYMLTRGQMYLRPFAPRCQAVDVEALLEAVALTLSRVEELGPTRLHEFDWGLAPRVSPKFRVTLTRIF